MFYVVCVRALPIGPFAYCLSIVRFLLVIFPFSRIFVCCISYSHDFACAFHCISVHFHLLFSVFTVPFMTIVPLRHAML